MAARNMHRIEINIQEKIVRQIGYLQGSYQDARTTKHKMFLNLYRMLLCFLYMGAVEI